MGTTNLHDFFQRLNGSMAANVLGDEVDRRLVERVLNEADATAFSAIVARHGPMVYRVCWRVLHHSQETEDAFQSTFLILAKKLRTLRKRGSLASWLHGVAHRVALKARDRSDARLRREMQVARPDVQGPEDVTSQELNAVLDVELSQLPDRWRQPLILCYLEGHTQDEAASQLGWSKSTLRRRLSEARDALGARLKRRDLTWSAAMSSVLVSDCVASYGPSSEAVLTTVRAAWRIVTGGTLSGVTSIPIATLTEGVLRTMFLSKLKATALVIFCVGLLTAGVGGLSHMTRVAANEETQSQQPSGADDQNPERLLTDAARKLTDARRSVQAQESILTRAREELDDAQQRYDEALDRYRSATIKANLHRDSLVSGILIDVTPENLALRAEYWKEIQGDSKPWISVGTRAYETFSVAKGAEILQDNIKTKLSELRKGCHITLTLEGDVVSKITADGGVVQGPIRFASADPKRNTITVTSGNDDVRSVYHLVKETELTNSEGKKIPLNDLPEGTLLLLTRSVADVNTVICIEALADTPVRKADDVKGRLATRVMFEGDDATRVAKACLELLASCSYSSPADDEQAPDWDDTFVDTFNNRSHLHVRLARPASITTGDQTTIKVTELLVLFPLNTGSVQVRVGDRARTFSKYEHAKCVALQSLLTRAKQPR